MVVVLWYVVYSIWNRCNIYRLTHYGTVTIGTIIKKHSGILDYDVEYDGEYYISRIRVDKKKYRQIHIGEHYRAIILPDKLKYHINKGLTPSYIGISLQPLPEDCQDMEAECSRIDSMYVGRKKTLRIRQPETQ